MSIKIASFLTAGLLLYACASQTPNTATAPADEVSGASVVSPPCDPDTSKGGSTKGCTPFGTRRSCYLWGWVCF